MKLVDLDTKVIHKNILLLIQRGQFYIIFTNFTFQASKLNVPMLILAEEKLCGSQL
jgi:hypothetical protein